MSGFGIVSAILTCIGYLLVCSVTTAIFVAVCFYGFWYTVKNSPTLRTRRFVIQAAMDCNLLIWVFSYAHLPTVQVAIFSNFSHDFEHLCSSSLLLGVFAFFVLYVILRWRKILYEDLGGQISVPKIDTEPGEFRKMLGETLETEYRWFANWIDRICRLRNYFLTATGLRVKRNVVAWLIAVFLAGYAALVIFILLQIPFENLTTSARTLFYAFIVWGILVPIIIQVLFFRVVSFGMKISEDESALKNTPPKISSEHWNPEELAPQSRRRILYNAVILLAAIPLCMLLQFEVWDIVREINRYFGSSISYSINFDINTLIEIETVLVALAVLWGSRYPHFRFLGYALLFLVSGLWTVFDVELILLSSSGLPHLHRFFLWWLDTETQNQIIHQIPMSEFYFYHCFAITWFIYSLLAAAICYGIHRLQKNR